MSKPMLVTLPFVLLLLDVWPLRRMRKEAVVEKVPLFALAAASGVVTFLVQRRGGAVAGLEALPLILRIENAAVSYVAYIGAMLWPARLAPFYPYGPLPIWSVALSVLGLAAVSAAAIRAGRRFPYVPVGWLWYLGTLAPAIGIIQVGDQSRADRYTYAPLIGLFLIAAWGSHDLLARRRHRNAVLAAAGATAIAICATGARSQARLWQSSVTVWEHTLRATENNALAHSNLAIAFWEKGDIPAAIAHYTEALRIRPNVATDHGNLGVALAGQGDVEGAVRELREAVRLKPADATYQYNLGLMLMRSGKATESRRHFEAALAAEPQYEDARRMLDSLSGRIQP
jgi:tetratricopeptide (TPR) repeat protein